MDEYTAPLGVSASIATAMNSCGADTIMEDNMLFRTCTHGVKHPVAHLHRRLYAGPHGNDGDQKRHHRSLRNGFVSPTDCCGCCEGIE